MRLHFIGTVGLVLLLTLTAACGSQRPFGTAWHEAKVRTIGATAVKTLSDTLMGRVMAAIQEGGLAHAVDFCSVEALPVTAAVEREAGLGLRIKRTSLQYRNPLNAPDANEAAALEYFEQALAEMGTLPADYVQFVNVTEYRYYRPIVVAQNCLACHGDPAQFEPALRQVLETRYPDDRATGYQEGDFRGVVRVSVPTSRLR